MTTVNMISMNGKHYITLKNGNQFVQTITTGNYWRALFVLYISLRAMGKSEDPLKRTRARRVS